MPVITAPGFDNNYVNLHRFRTLSFESFLTSCVRLVFYKLLSVLQ